MYRVRSTHYWSRWHVGKQGSPPHITTSKLQLNYRTTIIQNNRIKEESTSRLVGGAETRNGLV